MSKTYNVAVLVGSLRKASYNRRLANILAELAPGNLKLNIVEIGDLPFYNEDLETDAPPASWTRFRSDIKAADAVLFITPEYNRTTTAPIKNAIDVGSRPYGKSVWGGKPGAVVSASMGAQGGFGANHHLRQSLVFINVLPLQQPEAYIGGVQNLIDDQGKVTNDGTKKFLTDFMAAFGKWIEKAA